MNILDYINKINEIYGNQEPRITVADASTEMEQSPDSFLRPKRYDILTGQDVPAETLEEWDTTFRRPNAEGGIQQLVRNTVDGSRPGYSGSFQEMRTGKGTGFYVSFGQRGKDNYISQFFGPREYGSSAEAKKAAKTFFKETQQTWTSKAGQREGKGVHKALRSVFDNFIKEGVDETSFQDIKNKLPKKILKDIADKDLKTQISFIKNKHYPNMKYKRTSPKFLKAPGEVAKVTELIEQGLPMKELKAKGFSEKFILNVAENSNLKIAETTRDYYDNIKKITKDITTLGKNKDILDAFKKGELTDKLIAKTGSIIKSKDPFYNSRILFKLAEYYDGSLEGYYKVDLPKPTDSQITNSKKVIKTSSKLMGGKKRTGYAFDSSLYQWGGKQIDKAFNLPLGSFYKIQQEIIKELPSGISLDEVFGIKSSGRYAPVEGVLVNPLDVKTNISKGILVDTIKSTYHKDLIANAGNPEAQEEILKNYRETVNKTKKKYRGVEFPDYEIGKPPNKTIKSFDKLGPQIKKQLLANYKETGISPKSTKAMSIFDIAQATGSKTFAALDKKTKSGLLGTLLDNFWCGKKQSAAGGGRIGFSGSCPVEVKQKNFLRMTNDVANGKITGEAAEQIAKNAGKVVAKAGSKSALASIFGPAGIGIDIAYEVGSVGIDMYAGKPWKEAVQDNWIAGAFMPGTGQEEFHRRLFEEYPVGYPEEDKTKKYPEAKPYGSGLDLIDAYNKKQKQIDRLEADTTARGRAEAEKRLPGLERDLRGIAASYNALGNVMQPGSPEYENYMAAVTEARDADKAKSGASAAKLKMELDRPISDRFTPRDKSTGMEIDYDLPKPAKISETPLSADQLQAYAEYHRDVGDLEPRGELPQWYIDEIQQKEKWRQLFEQPGIRGTQDWRGAGGGMVGIRRPSALPPTGGPMSQGLRSLYINDKDY